MIPINLVFQMSDFRYEIKETSLPCIWLEILTENPGQFVLTNTNNWSWFQVGWSGRWWRCWRDLPRTDPPTLTMCDLKKWKNINTHPIDRSSLYLLYIGLAIKFLMWSQITFLLSIRLIGGRQIDFKVSSLFEGPRKYFIKLKFKFPKV